MLPYLRAGGSTHAHVIRRRGVGFDYIERTEAVQGDSRRLKPQQLRREGLVRRVFIYQSLLLFL